MKSEHTNLLFLRYFVDAVELRSVSMAAKKNNVTLSAVSQGLRRLELDLGFSLTTRKKKQFMPTQDGLKFFHKAIAILKSVDSILNEDNTHRSLIRIGCSSSLFGPFVIPALKKWNGMVKLKFGTSSAIRELLSEGKIDIGIMVDDGFVSHFKYVVLSRGSFMLLGKKNSLAKGIIVTEDRQEVIELIHKLSHLGLSQEHIKMRVDSWSACYSLAKAGFGASLVPDFFDRKGLVRFHPKAINFSYQVVAIHAPTFDPKPFSHLVEKFKNTYNG